MRASGILLPVSSLPSKYGIGCFSEEAYEFVDQLARAGQKYWQILPLGPTGYGDSPYQSFSTFAGNPYFIDLEAFVKEGYLDKSDCEDCDWGTNESYVDYEKIYNSRFRLLRKAFENYDCETDQEYRKFVKENAAWLEDYSLYMAIKDSLNGISWIEWPTELKNREKAALAEEREKLAKEVPDCKVSVYCLDDQDKLREEIANADILANGTLAGMKPHDDLTLVDKSMFHKDLVVADCVYNPAETKMVKEAKEAGVKLAVGGKGMLLWQGAESYKLYTGLEMPTDEYQKFQAENEGK